jgi:hypothetical protein
VWVWGAGNSQFAFMLNLRARAEGRPVPYTVYTVWVGPCHGSMSCHMSKEE